MLIHPFACSFLPDNPADSRQTYSNSSTQNRNNAIQNTGISLSLFPFSPLTPKVIQTVVEPIKAVRGAGPTSTWFGVGLPSLASLLAVGGRPRSATTSRTRCRTPRRCFWTGSFGSSFLAKVSVMASTFAGGVGCASLEVEKTVEPERVEAASELVEGR